MKHGVAILTLAFALLIAGAPPTLADMTDGLVIKVDQPAEKITIKHGPMKKFDMEDAMTMVYRVQDPAMLKIVKAGDKIKFDAERINGQFTVTKLQKQ
jgi:Cu/Ag efflux protein CusF